MRVVFLGTPDFAVKSLSALAEVHEVVAVVTQPDRPRGRGGKITPSPIKVEAERLGICVYQFEKISTEGVDVLKMLSPDIMVTAAYGQILSDEVLSIPPKGVINVHASLLPLHRGSSPIQNCILKGDKTTGVTIMQTAREVDSGDILHVKKLEISDLDGTVSLTKKLSELGAIALLEAMELIDSGKVVAVPQEHDKATFCKLIKKADTVIDWAEDAETVSRKIRAYDYIGASSVLHGEVCKLYCPKVTDGYGKVGEIIECSDKTGVVVKCGAGAVNVGEMLLAGGKRQKCIDLVRGRKLQKGLVLG